MRSGVLQLSMIGLNAPVGARCFLTENSPRSWNTPGASLNAPFGARCFLTKQMVPVIDLPRLSLNAPFGARCFLTARVVIRINGAVVVLMHLLALGAF